MGCETIISGLRVSLVGQFNDLANSLFEIVSEAKLEERDAFAKRDIEMKKQSNLNEECKRGNLTREQLRDRMTEIRNEWKDPSLSDRCTPAPQYLDAMLKLIAKGNFPTFRFSDIKLAYRSGIAMNAPSSYEDFHLAINSWLLMHVIVKQITVSTAKKLLERFDKLHDQIWDPIPMSILVMMAENCWSHISTHAVLKGPKDIDEYVQHALDQSSIWMASEYRHRASIPSNAVVGAQSSAPQRGVVHPPPQRVSNPATGGIPRILSASSAKKTQKCRFGEKFGCTKGTNCDFLHIGPAKAKWDSSKAKQAPKGQNSSTQASSFPRPNLNAARAPPSGGNPLVRQRSISSNDGAKVWSGEGNMPFWAKRAQGLISSKRNPKAKFGKADA